MEWWIEKAVRNQAFSGAPSVGRVLRQMCIHSASRNHLISAHDSSWGVRNFARGFSDILFRSFAFCLRIDIAHGFEQLIYSGYRVWYGLVEHLWIRRSATDTERSFLLWGLMLSSWIRTTALRLPGNRLGNEPCFALSGRWWGFTSDISKKRGISCWTRRQSCETNKKHMFGATVKLVYRAMVIKIYVHCELSMPVVLLSYWLDWIALVLSCAEVNTYLMFDLPMNAIVVSCDDILDQFLRSFLLVAGHDWTAISSEKRRCHLQVLFAILGLTVMFTKACG